MTLTIRDATPADAPAIQAIYAPVVRETPISFEVEPPDVAEMMRRMEAIVPAYPYFVAERDGAVLGYCYAARYKARAAYSSSVETTVYVASDARGQGVGRALYGPLIDELRRRGFHSALAGITLPNAGSVGLHEAMGFKPVGVTVEVGQKFGRYHDVGWWQLML